MPTTNHENVLNHFIGALFCNSFFLLWFCGFWLANMLLQNTLKLRLLAKCLKHRSRVKKCRKGGIMQELYATPACACCFYVFNLFTLFFEGGEFLFIYDAWCTIHNTWWILSRLCLDMSSFLHTCACVRLRTFLLSREILFPA